MRSMPLASPIISVVSSFTDDILLNEAGDVLAVQAGGPAHFIGAALTAEAIPFEYVCGERIAVEILVTANGEFGKVPLRPARQPLPTNLHDWTIISTILTEWDVLSRPLPTFTCLDLQGFERSGESFGKKVGWQDVEKIADDIFCLKGTQEEIALLPERVRKQHKFLVVTNGAAGIDIYKSGKRTHIDVQKVDNLGDTIGAGDTFFAHFVAALSKGKTPIRAARAAANQTTAFLKAKQVPAIR